MTSPNPRSKLLPARGNRADLEFWIEDILDGEMVYAYDEDQYYQKEGEFLVPVGATKAQGALADTALQDAPNDAKQYGRSGGNWVEIDTTDTGAVGAGTTGEFPYYAADGQVLSPASGSVISYNPTLQQVEISKIAVDEFNLSGEFNVESLQVQGTGPARIDSGSDLILAPTGDVDLDANVIKNLADPANAQDAATKNYVDQAIITEISSYPVNVYNFDPTSTNIFTVTGPGLPASGRSNPDLVLYKGMRYQFNLLNNELGNIEMLIKINVTAGSVNQYDPDGDWVTGDSFGTQFMEVPFDISQAILYYVDVNNPTRSGDLLIRPEN